MTQEKQTRTEQVLEGMIRHYEQVMQDSLPAGRLELNDIDYIQSSSKNLEAMARTLHVYKTQGFKDIDIEEAAEDAEDKDEIIRKLKDKLRKYENESTKRYAEYIKDFSIEVKSKKYEKVSYDITYMAWYDRTIVYVVDDRQGIDEPSMIELLGYSWGDAREEDFCKAENLDKMFDRYYDNDKNDTRTNVVIARAGHIRDYADGLMAEYDDETYAYDAGQSIKSQAESIIESLVKEEN